MDTNNMIVGLPNMSNTCYINSLLQCLMSFQSYRLFCNQFKPNLNVLNLFTSVTNSKKCVSVKDYSTFLKSLQSILPTSFQLHEQNDTHELYVLIIDHYYESLGLKNYVKDLFFMEIEKSIVCRHCGNECKNVDSSSAMCLSHEASLQEAIDNHFQSILISDWKCDKCNRKDERTHMTYELRHAPEIMAICVKRYSTSSNKNTIVPHYLDMSKYILDTKLLSDSNGCRYMLRSFINHRGILNYGHYHAYVLYDIPEHQKILTIKIDDETSSVAKLESDVNTNDIYMLFYERITTA